MGDDMTNTFDVVCTGTGSTGDHCCYIGGEVCEFLDRSDPRRPLCGVWDTMGDETWQNAPVGQWFARKYPGYTCIDWPQNIPEVMARGRGLCCWGDR
jgi:hypothetical protein